ncbi:MAG: Ig-like domain-containing protein, partial [Muribaculaceae bacterium]|nr:Ig-like domain-containing protein [Muribaculaceae bacterium]
ENGDYEITALATELKTKQITVSAPGDLEKLIPPSEAVGISSLTLAGPINAKDLKYIKKAFGYLENLDLSATTIESYIDEDEKYDSNILPASALSDMHYLKYVNLPGNLIKISNKSFADNSIEIINIPATVTEIEPNAFVNANYLTDIMVHWPYPINILGDALSHYVNYDECTLYVPIGSADLYREYPIWNRFVNIEEREDFNIIPISYTAEGVKYVLNPKDLTAEIIGSDSFLPANVQIPAYVRYEETPFKVIRIGDGAFALTSIESFEMPNTIETLCDNAFSGCTKLNKVNISSAVKVIPRGCFSGTAIRNITLPEDLEYVAFEAFGETIFLESLHIPAKTQIAGMSFIGISSCTSLTVDESNPYYKAIDNILYSKDGKTVILLAGGIEGKVSFPKDVEELPYSYVFYEMPNVTEIEVPRLKSLPSMFIQRCPQIKHITIPDESNSDPGPFITDCESLESITLGRNFEETSEIHRNPKLTNIYLRNKAVINIHYIFGGEAGHDCIGYYGLNFYTDQIHNNVRMDDCITFYVPGSVSEQFGTLPENKVVEMWEYQIDRENGLLNVDPLIEGLIIDKVTINGVKTTAEQDGLYHIGTTDDLDVVIDFTLHGRQAMTTHYDAAFNASLSDTDLSKVTEIVLNESELSLYVGQSIQLLATVLPDNATDKTVVWSSGNESVATVDTNGKVTAVSLGTATITARYGGYRCYATCAVSVVPTPVESITLSQETATLKVGRSIKLSATVLPEVADKTVEWTSNAPEVAVVDTEGKVTAVSIGEAVITATAADGSGVSANCTVTVEPILVYSLSITPERWDGIEGERFSITAIVLPENATNKSRSWSSSNPEIATVDADGNVTLLKDRYCTIEVSTLDGSNLVAKCFVVCRSGIAEIFADKEANIDVYLPNGVMVKHNCTIDEAQSLVPGIYIIRCGNNAKTVYIRN